MKEGIRIAALASGPIRRGRPHARALLVCIVGNSKGVEGVLSTYVEVDGADSTKRIAGMMAKSRFMDQVRVIALNGIAVAGLNIVDVNGLGKRLGAEILIVTRHRPRSALLSESVRKFADAAGVDASGKLKIIAAQGRYRRTAGFYAWSSFSWKETELIVPYAAKLLRLSHMIASGVSVGESRGRI